MATDQHGRPIRELPNDTTDEELRAGHIIPGADPPRNDDARGGFGNRDGKQGYGTDSEDGISAVSVNETADAEGHPGDNMRSVSEGRPRVGVSEDVPLGLDDLEPYDPANAADAPPGAEPLTAPRRRNTTSDTGPSGDPSVENLLTEDGNNVRRDARISGQDMTFEDLDRDGTNADLTDPDAQRAGIDHQI